MLPILSRKSVTRDCADQLTTRPAWLTRVAGGLLSTPGLPNCTGCEDAYEREGPGKQDRQLVWNMEDRLTETKCFGRGPSLAAQCCREYSRPKT